MVLAEVQGAVAVDRQRLPDGEVGQVGRHPDRAADGDGGRCPLQEQVERARLVAFQVRHDHVAQGGRVDDPGDRLVGIGKGTPEAGLHQGRLLVADDEEADVDWCPRDLQVDPEDVGGDLGDGGHG